ncbi:MAG: High molecular weight rubredoxin [Chloroflexi bacterium]|nr:High molecular weight rubredoxin [Chloroflexota bacterium]
MDLRALYPISYGLYIVGSRKGDKINAQIANTVIQVCSEPPTISVCLNKGNLTHEYIKSSKVFTVSVLAQDTPLNFVGNFGFKSGRDINKFENVKYKLGETKAPLVLEHALSVMEAKVVNEADAGTHTIFVGELVGAEVLKEGEPMTYAYYRQVKRGTTPKTAPSYVEQKKEKEADTKLAKYKCSVCGYVYDPSKGDPDNGIKPGTPFEKLPDDWTCPVCGASKSEFEKL